MEIDFRDDKLRRLEVDAGFDDGRSQNVVRAYRKLMRAIRAATDERDLRALQSLRFKKLRGSRSHQHAMRLNDQWRLIFEIVSSSPKNIIWIVAIEDYH